MVDATYRNEKSLNGHRLDVLKSGLQKYIRRGDLEGALYCAGELDCFSDAGQLGERIRTNMIHRLMIIYIEDIGLAGYGDWRQVDQLVKQWESGKRTNPMYLKQLVHLLCVSPKTRGCSFARAFSRQTHYDLWKDNPDYKQAIESLNPIDLKTAVETRSWSAIRILLSTLDQKYVREYDSVLKLLRDEGGTFTMIASEWIREIKTAERPLIPLLVLLQLLFGGSSAVSILPTYENDWNEHRLSEPRIFESFVMDKHVKGGNPSHTFWLETSSQVNNEQSYTPKLFRAIYEMPLIRPVVQTIAPSRVLHPISSSRETDYSFVVRCQLVCTSLKTDTVMALDPKGVFVFLKGPFASTKPIEKFIQFQKEKQSRGMPFIRARLDYLIPDRWSSTPLGIRNQLARDKPWPFLVCDSVFEQDRVKTRVHKSVRWPETIVMDALAMNLTFNPLECSRAEREEWIQAIKFRVEFNIGDLADRNFIRGDDGHIYSVDEEMVEQPICVETALKKQRYELVRPFL